MAASGCGRPGSGKGAVGHWRVASLLTILSSSSSTKSVSCLGQCLQSLSPTWSLRTSFLSVSSLPLSFLLGSSVLSFPVQIGLWSCCPKPFVWTVYLMVPATPGGWSRQEQARRESPVAPMGCWAQDSTSPESGWQGCKHTAGTRHPCHPSSCDTYPFMLLPLPPGLTKNVLSTVSPFPRPWGTERPWYECKDATSLSGKLCG